MPYLFQNATAFDPYTGQGVPNAAGQVFAMSDTAFATPLTVILLSSGLQTTELVSDQYSQLPGFDAGDHLQVRFKSGEFTKVLNTSTPLVGPTGDTGKSAFEVAAEGGYAGTEAEYNATLSDAGNLVLRAEAAETAAVDAAKLVGAPADTAIATAISGPGTQTHTALSAAIDERQTRVTVGPTGEFPTINAALAAFPSGGVHLDLFPGSHLATPIPQNALMKNVTISGQGRNVTRVDVSGPLIESVINMDAWQFEAFHLNNTKPTNTDNGISAEYPRRWSIRKMHITGFGGDSILYKGGVNSWIFDNTFIARDTAQANGRSAIHTTALNADPNSAATTIQTGGNYVIGGKQYGYLFEGTTIGSSSVGDIVEHCNVGFRFVRSMFSVITPYTEGNIVGIEQHDCSPVFMGSVRDRPVITWSGVAFFDRRSVQVEGRYIDPGKGLVYGGSSGNRNFDTAPSIRWDTSSPNGRITGPVGSQVIRTDGVEGRVLYVKTEGAGNEGWVPVGPTDASTAQLTIAANEVNLVKRAGLQVFNRTTKRPVWATGPLPTDVWVFADGTTAHTPAL